MIRVISIKDRLKNQAATGGKMFQEALMVYGLERTVYRRPDHALFSHGDLT